MANLAPPYIWNAKCNWVGCVEFSYGQLEDASMVSNLVKCLSVLAFALPSLAFGGEELSRQTLDCKGVKISYVVVGTGEPVVLIHGWTASIATNWQLPGTLHQLAKN